MTATATPTVTVWALRNRRFRAVCSCGTFGGQERRSHARAKLDAMTHAYSAGCFTDWPLTRLPDGRPVATRSWRMPWWPWMAMVGAILGCSLYFSDPANADTGLTATQFAYVQTFGPYAVCPVIDSNHTINGLIGVTRGVMEDGFTAREAAQIVTQSIVDYCPRNIPLLQQLIAAGQRQQVI